jgi:hypothetical protein
MGLANAVKGATRPSQVITWTRAEGTPEDLSGATLTGFIQNVDTLATRAIVGTLNVTAPASGVFTWVYATGDVAEAGTFDVQFVASFGASPTPAKTLATRWIVEPALS